MFLIPETQVTYRLQWFSLNMPLDLAGRTWFWALYNFFRESAGRFHSTLQCVNKSQAQEMSQRVCSYARCLIKEGKNGPAIDTLLKLRERKKISLSFCSVFLERKCSIALGRQARSCNPRLTRAHTHYLSISTCLINLRRIKFEKVISHIFH